ncbi:dihydroxy-acid dehydratase [Pendulispora albinea]|uniref:Dihydroxy-acid dehydratase n=1 Tax=Pendulispora albinea TaxID=2741071 RepID=A0ABZ2M8I1_9BACT
MQSNTSKKGAARAPARATGKGAHSTVEDPAAVMAFARLDVPSQMLRGGPIAPGCFEGRDVTIGDAFEAVRSHAAGRMSRAPFKMLEDNACPGAGACGALVLDWIQKDRRPSEHLAGHAFENALASVAATVGSIYGVLHLLANAHEAGVDATIDDFDPIWARTPVLTDLKPGGRSTAVDMYRAGGVRLLTDGRSRGAAFDIAPRRIDADADRAARANRAARAKAEGLPRRQERARRRVIAKYAALISSAAEGAIARPSPRPNPNEKFEATHTTHTTDTTQISQTRTKQAEES